MSKYKDIFLWLVKIIFLLYVFFGIFIFLYQENFIYFPVKNYFVVESENISEDYENKIEILVVNKESDKIILYFGGNGEDISHTAKEFEKNLKEYKIYMMNYPGYGNSSGSPSEELIFNNAQKTFNYIKRKEKKDIKIIGRSLGTGVANFVASKNHVQKMILITPYDSIENLAKDLFPIYPIYLMLVNKYNSLKYIKETRSEKTLFLLAENDNVIDKKYSLNLFDNFTKNKELIIIKNVGHNTISNYKEYFSIIDTFLKK